MYETENGYQQSWDKELVELILYEKLIDHLCTQVIDESTCYPYLCLSIV